MLPAPTKATRMRGGAEAAGVITVVLRVQEVDRVRLRAANTEGRFSVVRVQHRPASSTLAGELAYAPQPIHRTRPAPLANSGV